ncbi:MAG: response regulator [Candidatus Kapaibacterium sp.]
MNKKILIVEDEKDIRKDLVKTLQLSNYETVDAEDGLQGLELAKAHHPDLIISDIMMPKFDGYKLLEELQKEPNTAAIPFLFLTAKSTKPDIREGINLGADFYITKPYDIDELLEAVRSRLKKSEATENLYNHKIEEITSNIRRSLPHEIRTPLNIILGFSEFLRKNYDKTSPIDAKEMLMNVYDSGRRLHKLFENYLFYANLEIISNNQEEINNLRNKKMILSENTLKDHLLHTAGNYGRSGDLELQIQDITLNMSEEYFLKMVEHIFENSLKFSDRGTKILISSRQKGSRYTLTITDNGRGLSEKQIKTMGAYVQFERKVYEQQGTGLGIAIVKRIVRIYNGEMIFDSKQGKYTSVSLILPCERS